MSLPARAPKLQIVPAREQDLPVVLDLLTEAARWSREQGIEGLWKVPYPAEWITPSQRRGEVFLAWDGDRPVGTLTFRWEDTPTWGARPRDAGYVHKLAVRRSRKGAGLGAEMIDWAGERVAATGRPWLRLDCLRSHSALRDYYISLGFQAVGEATVEGNTVILLQRPAGRRASNAPAAGNDPPSRRQD